MNMTLSYSRVHGPRGQYVVYDMERNEVSCPRAFSEENQATMEKGSPEKTVMA